jgi:hypothetical protein
MSTGMSPHPLSSVETNGHSEVHSDLSERRWIVQKFGGTSVGKFPVKIAKDIVRYIAQDTSARRNAC